MSRIPTSSRSTLRGNSGGKKVELQRSRIQLRKYAALHPLLGKVFHVLSHTLLLGTPSCGRRVLLLGHRAARVHHRGRQGHDVVSRQPRAVAVVGVGSNVKKVFIKQAHRLRAYAGDNHTAAGHPALLGAHGQIAQGAAARLVPPGREGARGAAVINKIRFFGVDQLTAGEAGLWIITKLLFYRAQRGGNIGELEVVVARPQQVVAVRQAVAEPRVDSAGKADVVDVVIAQKYIPARMTIRSGGAARKGEYRL